MVSWKVDQTVSLPFPKWICFMGKNKILAGFSSNTTKSVVLQPFRENSFSVQISLFSEWFAAFTLSFVAALPECKYNLESFLYLIACVRWLKSCFKTSITYCKCVKPFVHIYLKQMYFSVFIYLFSLFTLHTDGEDKPGGLIFAEILPFTFLGSHILARCYKPHVTKIRRKYLFEETSVISCAVSFIKGSIS